MQHEQMPHTLQMKQRRELTVTGVTEVVSFEDTAVLLQTVMGRLLIQGQQLQLTFREGDTFRVDGCLVQTDVATGHTRIFSAEVTF